MHAVLLLLLVLPLGLLAAEGGAGAEDVSAAVRVAAKRAVADKLMRRFAHPALRDRVEVFFGEYGWGVRAKRDFEPGDVVYGIRGEDVFDVAACEAEDPEVVRAMRRRFAGSLWTAGLDQATLIVCLLRQDLLGAASRWRPWLAALPREPDQLPLAVLAPSVTNTDMIRSVLDGEAPDALHTMELSLGVSGPTELLVEFVEAEQLLGPGPTRDEIRSAVHWVMSLIWSRAWNGDLHTVFPPMMEMANHQAGGTQAGFRGDSVELRAHTAIREGDEVFNTYFVKSHSPAKMLMTWGFLPAEDHQYRLEVTARPPNAAALEDDERWLRERGAEMGVVERALWELRVREKRAAPMQSEWGFPPPPAPPPHRT